jgi:hypothetical protein
MRKIALRDEDDDEKEETIKIRPSKISFRRIGSDCY